MGFAASAISKKQETFNNTEHRIKAWTCVQFFAWMSTAHSRMHWGWLVLEFLIFSLAQVWILGHLVLSGNSALLILLHMIKKAFSWYSIILDLYGLDACTCLDCLSIHSSILLIGIGSPSLGSWMALRQTVRSVSILLYRPLPSNLSCKMPAGEILMHVHNFISAAHAYQWTPSSGTARQSENTAG